MSSPHLKAVIFDIGGVVAQSPFVAIAAYEHEKGLPPNYLNVSIVARGPQGAWQKLERGELGLPQFYDAFGAELSDTRSGNTWYADYCAKKRIHCPHLPGQISIDGRDLFGRMMRATQKLNEPFVEAIKRIRATGRFKVIALTNGYSKAILDAPPSELAFLGWQAGAAHPLRALFDDFCDSSEVGTRKPEPGFYLLACRRNGVAPADAVFLDDIGLNLKAARELGMDTIHVPVDGAVASLGTLEQKIGVDLGLRDAAHASRHAAKM